MNVGPRTGGRVRARSLRRGGGREGGRAEGGEEEGPRARERERGGYGTCGSRRGHSLTVRIRVPRCPTTFSVRTHARTLSLARPPDPTRDRRKMQVAGKTQRRMFVYSNSRRRREGGREGGTEREGGKMDERRRESGGKAGRRKRGDRKGRRKIDKRRREEGKKRGEEAADAETPSSFLEEKKGE